MNSDNMTLEPALKSSVLLRILADLPPIGKDGPWLAGGAVRRSLAKEGLDSDFDFFFKDAEQMAEFRGRLKNRRFEHIVTTRHHETYRGIAGGRLCDVQCINFAYYPDARVVIDRFDFTICQFAFDGEQLIAGERSMEDLTLRRLVVNTIPYPNSTASRLKKYQDQGFAASEECVATIAAAVTKARAENRNNDLDYQQIQTGRIDFRRLTV